MWSQKAIQNVLSKKQATDATSLAIEHGYPATGKRVIVCDGKVISHSNMDWFSFIRKMRCIKRALHQINAGELGAPCAMLNYHTKIVETFVNLESEASNV